MVAGGDDICVYHWRREPDLWMSLREGTRFVYIVAGGDQVCEYGVGGGPVENGGRRVGMRFARRATGDYTIIVVTAFKLKIL